MLFILKYQRFPVMDIDITVTPHGFNVNRILNIYNRELLPLPLRNVPIKEMKDEFIRWYGERMIPRSRTGLADVSAEMSKSAHLEKIDLYGAVKIMSLLSYGRNMTDKFWISPARETMVYTGNPDMGLNGEVIRPHLTYKGMDFHKNGTAGNFGHIVKNPSGEVRTNVDYNCPDFCTNGETKKRFVWDSGMYWLEKYVSCPLEEFREKALKMKQASTECPEHFNGFQILVDENGVPEGYRTRCLTTKDSELVTLKDICLNADYTDRKFTQEKTVRACMEFGLDEEKIQSFLEKITKYMDGKDIYENAGFLVDVTSKNIIQMTAWI